MTADHLGIDIGSTNVKLCLLSRDGEVAGAGVLAHEGNVQNALGALLDQFVDALARPDVTAAVTGTEGRHRVALPETIAAVAVEKGIAALGLRPSAVVAMGGEDLVVYALDEQSRIVSTFAGNKCASGTGEFFVQQLGRMNLSLDDLEHVSRDGRTLRLSSRCSVFMKSDCTHRLNKGEATPGDIALSLCKVMADKISDFLTKARIEQGEVVLIGGVTRNVFLVRFLCDAWPSIRFIIPDQAAYFEAFGAAHIARESGSPLPPRGQLFTKNAVEFYDRLPPLRTVEQLVHHVPSRRGSYDPDAEYILGVDGGSTTTKAALVNAATLEIVAEHYGRTHGDPIAALRQCIVELKRQIGNAPAPRIGLVATTGSSRELLGVFLETNGVYNEIIAHAVGTTHFDPEIDTIFEIGGQDAKYVFLEGGIPIDYAMNEACSAGTGSFLEESARGDLNIPDAREIGPIALLAPAPLKFGEHCSAFINSDIRKAIQQGASREDIAAGIVFSVVTNYLNRVVGNRMIGKRIALQGGVAKNPAIPLAFAAETNRSITVPPDPELMGCFGVALLARRKRAEGLLADGAYSLDEILAKHITTKNAFTCKSCDNCCEIRNLEVAGRTYPFGGRCSKFTVARRKKAHGDTPATDYTEIRTRMLLCDFAPDPATLQERTDKVVGVPAAFSFHSLWPFYAWYFHTLGVRTVVSDRVSPEGIAKTESAYCFPAEIAHGAVQDVLDKGVDLVFLPHFADMPSLEADLEHGTLCPLTQGLPYFIRKAFGLSDDRILRPLVSFKRGWDASAKTFEELAVRLGFGRKEGRNAYDKGIRELRRFLEAYRALGEEVLEKVRRDPDRLYVALFGRPYNAFTRDANMGIPRKLTSQGITVIPFDMIYEDDAEIFPNMYWYYGQQDMKAVRRILPVENLYLTWVSNFSCAPDSFMLHYLRWMHGRKPYLVLEIDSHTADAGLDTRIEAFCDIVGSYRKVGVRPHKVSLERRYRTVPKREFMDIVDTRTGEIVDIRDRRVTAVFPSMGDLSSEAAAAAANKAGVHAVFLPVPDTETVRLARAVASGKECIPALLVLGSILKFMRQRPEKSDQEIFLFFIPSTTGPCRTGQYYVFYDRLLEELGFENAIMFVSESDNSYRELGPTFNREIWWALTLGDYFTDLRIGLRLLAKDAPDAMELFDRCWRRVLAGMRSDRKSLEQALAEAGRELAAVPRRRTLGDLRRVLIVGEIFVRRDTFSVREVSDYLVAKGIFPKVTDVTEWVRYTDFTRKADLDRAAERDGFARSVLRGTVKEKAIFHVESAYKNYVEHKIARHLVPTGLIVRAPHDMKRIMATAEKHFIDLALESEATVSSGVGGTAMLEEGFDGVVIIAPFACLPGRLLEGVYVPWARSHGFPSLTLENDAQPYPPSTVARMELFAHNVLRFERKPPPRQ